MRECERAYEQASESESERVSDSVYAWERDRERLYERVWNSVWAREWVGEVERENEWQKVWHWHIASGKVCESELKMTLDYTMGGERESDLETFQKWESDEKGIFLWERRRERDNEREREKFEKCPEHDKNYLSFYDKISKFISQKLIIGGSGF